MRYSFSAFASAIASAAPVIALAGLAAVSSSCAGGGACKVCCAPSPIVYPNPVAQGVAVANDSRTAFATGHFASRAEAEAFSREQLPVDYETCLRPDPWHNCSLAYTGRY